jgi:hypothetical protein
MGCETLATVVNASAGSAATPLLVPLPPPLPLPLPMRLPPPPPSVASRERSGTAGGAEFDVALCEAVRLRIRDSGQVWALLNGRTAGSYGRKSRSRGTKRGP